MADTLLLADDSVTMQRVVQLTFAEQGLDVVSVSDGQQAIDYITAHRPALALVSVSLQKVNGFDVARFVRDQTQIGGLPVLLLAGAFDTIDQAQVRESGAAGVLVKPFEPAVVIKRVKELLGISKDEATRPVPVRPSTTSSGRFVTSPEAPTRPGSAVRDPIPATATPPDGASALTAGVEQQTNADPAHDRRDEMPGFGSELGGGGEDSGVDYLQELDAAFDSLDAQLAGRPAPPGAATNPPPPLHIPAALDPERRPSAATELSHETAAEATLPPVSEPSAPAVAGAVAANPVFEIDDNWFEKKPTVDIGDLGDFVVTRATDHVPSQPVAAAAADATPFGQSAPASVDDDRSWAPGGSTPREEAAEPVETIKQPPVAEPPPATLATPPGANPADTFGTMWAPSPGEPVPSSPTPAMELSESSVDALAARVSDAIASRLISGLAERVTNGIADRMGQPLATRLTEDLPRGMIVGLGDRLTGGIADRVSQQLPGPIAAGVSERIVAGVSERVTAGVSERVSADLAERLSENLADRLAGPIAESISAAITDRVAASVGNRLASNLVERLAASLEEPVVTGVAERVTAGVSGPLTTGIAERITAGIGERVTDGLTDRVTVGVAERVTDALVHRVTSDLADRVATGLADRVTQDLADRVTAGVAERSAPAVADRVAPEIADRMTSALGDRLASGLAERVSATVAEQLLQNTLGESLRQTVNDVSERVVRAEIDRIRAAASLRSS